jgi:3,4-dihydroxy 2-butanone 4-phosphate synthase/GTP cyclohydrolase II
MAFSRIEDGLAEIKAGRFVILTEGESGESQLCMAAELVTADAVNFMAMHGRGLVCLSMTDERLRQLGIPLMAPEAPSVVRRSYGASIEARRGVTTGISAHDRATTTRRRWRRGGPDDTVMSDTGADRRARRARWCAPVHRGGDQSRPGLGRQAAAAVCAILTDDGSSLLPDLRARGICSS